MITIQTGTSPESHTEVFFAIHDSGAGIDPDIRQKIFHPFFTAKEKGTGLGLAIVQKIVLSHDGRIEVESTPGNGATFTVFLLTD